MTSNLFLHKKNRSVNISRNGRLLLICAFLSVLIGIVPPYQLPVISAKSPDDAEALEDKLERTRQKVPDSSSNRQKTYALARLQLVKARLADSNYRLEDTRRRKVADYVKRAEELVETLMQDQEPSLEREGRIERAYIAPNDGSVQPYYLFVPDSYDETQPTGLLVYLHGYSPDLNRENWIRSMYPEVLDSYASESGTIVVMPFARGNTDFQGCGEDDVLHVIDRVQQEFNIDSDRIILSGYSMGGMGVWTIGGHYPDKFAALWAMSSRADFYMWKDLSPDELAPFKTKLAEREFGANLMPNYRHLPAFLVHGDMDFAISPEQSARMYRRLKDRGNDVRYHKRTGKGHLFFYRRTETDAEIVEWLKEQKRVKDPSTVTYRTYDLRYNEAYWVQILGMKRWDQPAEVHCELDRENARITLETDNVMALRLTPPLPETTELEDVTLIWNDNHTEARVEEGALILGGQHMESDRPVKNSTLAGPLREVFSDSFIMVYGNGTDAAIKAAEKVPVSRKLCEYAARDWNRFAKGRPRVKAADELTADDIRNNHLLLFGTPRENPLIDRVIPDIPLDITGTDIELAGRSYDLRRHGVWMIYPNPLSPDRYVVINAGLPWGTDLPENHKYEMIPDFIVYTDAPSDEGTEWCNRFRAAGFFNQFWELSDGSSWFVEEPR